MAYFRKTYQNYPLEIYLVFFSFSFPVVRSFPERSSLDKVAYEAPVPFELGRNISLVQPGRVDATMRRMARLAGFSICIKTIMTLSRNSTFSKIWLAAQNSVLQIETKWRIQKLRRIFMRSKYTIVYKYDKSLSKLYFGTILRDTKN